MPQPIYLDHQASTPLDPAVLASMMPLLTSTVGNASSTHAFGTRASETVERARAEVADLTGARPRDVIFTSGASEANNLALRGVLAAARTRGAHMVATETEHAAVLRVLEEVGAEGVEVTLLRVDRNGRLDLDELETSLRPSTVLVSVGLANNEIGTIQPLREVAAIAHAKGVLVHSDAAQAVGKFSIDVGALDVDLLSLSGHKFHGPAGVGALLLRERARGRVRAQIVGGGQEQGLRSGTLNVAGCAGLGAACAISRTNLRQEEHALRRRTKMLLDLLRDGDPTMRMNGPPVSERLPSNLNVTFPGAEADAVMASCAGVAMSAGSACTAGSPTTSHVLRAIGLSDEDAESTIRLGVGRFTTDREIADASAALLAAVRTVRARTAENTLEPLS